MKKLLSLSIFVFVAFTGFSQIRTIQSDKVLQNDVLKKHSITWSYTGIAADTLTILQDTLIYNITVNKAVPMNYYIKTILDTIAGADTLCTININGRMFDSDDWTLIETTATLAISKEISTTIESMTDASYSFAAFDVPYTNPAAATADTLEFPALMPVLSLKPCYRQIQVEIIIYGEDSTGGGIALKSIEWYFQEAKF